MKRLLSISICLLSYAFLFAQNYAPFPLNQKSFWQNENQVTQYYCDQQETIDADHDLLLFGANYLFPEGDCLDSIITFYVNDYYSTIKPAVVDSMVFSASQLYPFGKPSQYIQVDANFNQQWTVLPTQSSVFDSIVWVVTENSIQNWLENEEQVKIFEGNRYQGGQVVDILSLTLSEGHGFLQFTPFKEWWTVNPSQETLWGWEVDNEKAGFTHSFEDYFDLAPGSIFKYRTTHYYYGYEIIRDSVVSSAIDDTGLSYAVHRHTKHVLIIPFSYPEEIDSIYYTNEVLDLYISRSRYAADFEGTPGWFFYEEEDPNADHWGFRKMDTLLLDDNNLVQLKADPGIAINEDCTQSLADNFDVFRYCLGQNIGWVCEKPYVNAYINLIGYDIAAGSDGDYGPIDIVLGTENPPVYAKAAHIFPNPNNGQFTIELAPQSGQSALVIIKNIAGKTVFSETFESLDTTLGINVRHLPTGLYTVAVRTGKGLYTNLWVKE